MPQHHAELFNRYNVGAENEVMLKDLGYKQSDFVRVVSLINRLEITNSSDKSSSFFFGVGLNSYWSDYVANVSSCMPKQNLKPSFGPVLTVGADLFLNPAYQKIFVRFSADFFYNKLDYEAFGGWATYYHSFQQYNSVLSAVVACNLITTTKAKAYLGVGVSAQYIITANNISKFVSPERTTLVQAPEQDRAYFLIPFRTGVFYKNRYELALGYQSVLLGTQLQSSRFSVGVHYHLR